MDGRHPARRVPRLLPAQVEKLENGSWPNPLVLELGTEPVELVGIVQDAEGKPAEGVRVKLHSSTPFGFVAAKADELGAWVLDSSSSSSMFRRSVEELIGGTHGIRETVTDRNGRFRLTGLLPRDYLLVLGKSETLQGNTSRWVRAGEGEVRVRLAPNELLQRIAGRVFNGFGEPLAQVKITLQRNVDADYEEFPTATLIGGRRFTDAEGRFEFGPTARGGIALSVSASSKDPFEHLELDDDADFDNLRIVLSPLAEFYVDLSSQAEFADSFQILDADGEPAFLHTPHGMGGFAVDEGSIGEGRSPVYSAPAGPYELVLLRDGAEVLRRDVALQPGATRAFDL